MPLRELYNICLVTTLLNIRDVGINERTHFLQKQTIGYTFVIANQIAQPKAEHFGTKLLRMKV